MAYTLSGSCGTVRLDARTTGVVINESVQRTTKAEPDEPSRFAWLLLCPNGLYDRRDICSGVSTCLCQEIKKEATTQGTSCVVASLCFFIAITDFVIIYQNPARF